MKIKWEIKSFETLDTLEFHNILKTRINVFVVEQNCPYPELDDKDFYATHLMGKDECNEIIAYARLLPPGISYEESSIGRVLTIESVRGKGIGHLLIDQSIETTQKLFGSGPIKISAQEHLVQFYTQHGFNSYGESYFEDGIPHVSMLFTP